MSSVMERRHERVALLSAEPTRWFAFRGRFADCALPTALVVLLTALYSAYSLHMHALFQSNAFDLGIFGQGVKGYAEGRGPISEIKGPGFSLLGDHFSPIDALLAPVYAVFPSVGLLLVAQAFLVAVGVVPLVNWARRELGTWSSVAIAVVYASSFGVASAVAFDFHEVAWAAPLVSFSLCAIGQQKFREAVVWAAPLVLVKEDLGVTVAAIGGVLFLRRQRRLGAALAAFGLLSTAVETFVLIPAFNPDHGYAYSGQSGNFSLHGALQSSDTKVMTLLLTLTVGAFLSTRSSLLLAAVPTLLWRFVGANPAYWSTGFQYSLVLMPIVIAALVEVLVRRRADPGDGIGFVRWALAVSVSVNLLLALTFPLEAMLKGSFWSTSSRAGQLQAAVDEVPAKSRVAASNKIVPHLVDKDTVTLFSSATLNDANVKWIVADLTENWPETGDERSANVARAVQAGWRVVSSRDDIIVLRR